MRFYNAPFVAGPARFVALVLAGLFCAAPLVLPLSAADHADAPFTSNDAAADLNDSFIFLDPNDNDYIVISMTVRGFIVPGEAVNQGIFDIAVLYRFQIENTGDAKPDMNIDVTFSPREVTSLPQIATVRMPDPRNPKKTLRLVAPATNPSLATTAPAHVVTTDEATRISFFAGEVDDPFFFDIPAFSRYVASVRAGQTNRAEFDRGRDSFAGYNTMSIALRMPVTYLRGKRTPLVGLNVLTYRTGLIVDSRGRGRLSGPYRQVDRAATPAVNVALIPFGKKNAFNASIPTQDADAKFATDIVDTLILLGADDEHVARLANIAVFKGDYIRLDTRTPNTGPQGGTNPEARFPNGRRLADDTVDITLTEIRNGEPLGDNVDASDVPPRDVFPFFGLSQQPRVNGVLDDNTRN
jgi:hypothetical protein